MNKDVTTMQETKKKSWEEKHAARDRAARQRYVRRFGKRAAAVVGAVAAIGLLVWYVANRPPTPESAVVSRSGLHWHPTVRIVINGKEEKIPANIGVGVVHNPIHTHDPDNVIHLEMIGKVEEDDITLGRFFAAWGRRFSGDCIFDFCNGPEGRVAMSVNGAPNTDFEGYVMRDRDTIEIRYEK